MDDKKILVIDRDEGIGRMVKSVLMIRGYQVDCVSNGRKGLETAYHETRALVFVDLKMDDLDSHYIVRELLHQDPHRAVILTAYPGEANLAAEAMQMGATDYLVKPLKAEEIHFKVKHALEFRAVVETQERALKGFEERHIALQKQNLVLARRIEESTKNLKKLYDDLRESYMRTIKALAHAIDARDHYTYAHSDNVTRYAELIARQMRIDSQQIDEIADACQLHDVGKIGVHDNLLSKPAALTPEEFAQIKLHSLKGAQILEPLNFMPVIIDIVKHHHERWDGKGYPDGLAGDRIPLGARIMAVADSFDAMVSPRPYRKVGLSRNEAIDEIKHCSGTQFDPRVVEAFLKVVDRF